jgi:hypothetical protein
LEELVAEFVAAVRAGGIMKDAIVKGEDGLNWFHRKSADQAWRAFLGSKGLAVTDPAYSPRGLVAVLQAMGATSAGGKRLHGRFDRAWTCPAW